MNTDDELLKLVQKHLIDVDNHGYVEGEDDVVAAKDLTALLHKSNLQRAIDELNQLDTLTHSFMSTGKDFIYEYRQSAIDDRIAELQAELQQVEKEQV